MAKRCSDNVSRISILVQLEHVHGIAEHEKCGEKDDHEVTDIVDSLNDQLDIEGGLLE